MFLYHFLQEGHELQHLQTLNTVDTDSLLNQQEVVTTIDYTPSDQLVQPHPTVPSVTTQLSHQGSSDLVQQLERLQQQQQHGGLNMLHSLTDASTSSPHDM